MKIQLTEEEVGTECRPEPTQEWESDLEELLDNGKPTEIRNFVRQQREEAVEESRKNLIQVIEDSELDGEDINALLVMLKYKNTRD
jgi:hypothetical protein